MEKGQVSGKTIDMGMGESAQILSVVVVVILLDIRRGPYFSHLTQVRVSARIFQSV